MQRRSPSILVLLLAAALLAWPHAVQALPPVVEQAKKAGVVGEQSDGYLGLVKGSAPADVRKAVDEINGARRTLYQQRAKQKGTDAATYAKVVGKTQIDREPSGNWVRGDSGWRKK